MRIPKAEAEWLRSEWVRALQDVAKQLGYTPNRNGESSHPVVRILGALAWGRHPKEGGPDETKDDVLVGLGYLQGVRDAALRAARELGDKEADRFLCNVPRRVQERAYR